VPSSRRSSRTPELSRRDSCLDARGIQTIGISGGLDAAQALVIARTFDELKLPGFRPVLALDIVIHIGVGWFGVFGYSNRRSSFDVVSVRVYGWSSLSYCQARNRTGFSRNPPVTLSFELHMTK
jgi:hypothetical protein